MISLWNCSLMGQFNILKNITDVKLHISMLCHSNCFISFKYFVYSYIMTFINVSCKDQNPTF